MELLLYKKSYIWLLNRIRKMKTLLFPSILSFFFLISACEDKAAKTVQTGDALRDTIGIQEVTDDTLDEFEYEADSVETDDDEDL
jgi:hypothetical protein